MPRFGTTFATGWMPPGIPGNLGRDRPPKMANKSETMKIKSRSSDLLAVGSPTVPQHGLLLHHTNRQPSCQTARPGNSRPGFSRTLNRLNFPALGYRPALCVPGQNSAFERSLSFDRFKAQLPVLQSEAPRPLGTLPN
jgi:hypothetical protein